MRAPGQGRGQGGFTYLGMIILVTVLGLVGAATLKIDALLRRAAAEEELLAVGTAFADALTSYAAATPAGQPTQPPTLLDLLRDSRSPAIRRHLRKVFIDPMTGTTDWGIVWLGDHQGVLAVYSKSSVQPLKIANFDARLAGFDGRQHMYDWRFVASVPAPLLPAAVPAPGPGAAPIPALPSLFAVPPPAAAPMPVPVEPPVAEPPAADPLSADDGQSETPTARPPPR
ncbi:type II secretion system protein [Massilia sp. PWRC2]|uniref:type II secretion system protein n=1 Tax=Massilia sp. PWRC2 TaxID=2804626 RepID=UPI003CF560F0